MEIHVVNKGETLASLAGQYGVSRQLLAADNGLSPQAELAAGQTLVIRFPETIHTVSAGETIYSIAQAGGLSVTDILRRNFILGGRREIYPGQTLVLSYREAPSQRIGVNGYAYPHISVDRLDSELPYLTYLTPFTYGIGTDGSLLPLDDTELRAAAGMSRTAAFLHVSSITATGQFSSEKASLLLHSGEMQENLMRSVLQTLRRKSFFGLDVDFEYLLAEDEELFTAFIWKLRSRLNPLGYPVLAALPPKKSDEQDSRPAAGHNYAALGEAANAVLLMAYEWGYTYGPPMAVAPLPQVRGVVEYAVSRIAPEKIFLGVPLYGYDWVLPYEPGVSKAKSISPDDAVIRARQTGAQILYDETAQSPYFSYYGRSGQEHVVWFEDARSLHAKLKLIEEYGLQGVSYWNLTRSCVQNWALLDSLYEIETLL